MPRLDPKIMEWMRTHHGTVSSDAMQAMGITKRQQRELVRTGQLRRVVNGAYAFPGRELDEVARCAALCAARPSLVITAPTAGRLWNLRYVPRDGLVSVIAPPGSRVSRAPWVKPHRGLELVVKEDIVVRPDGIRLMNPPRTVVGLARFVHGPNLELLIEHVLADRICSTIGLYRVLDRFDPKGRPWLRTLRAVLDARAPGAPCESSWEKRVLEALRSRGITDLRTQHRERLDGHGVVRFDISITDIKWVLEVDIHPSHRTVEGSSNDHRRDRHSRRAGWEVERVNEAELKVDFEAAIDDIVLSINKRRAQVEALRAAGHWQS